MMRERVAMHQSVMEWVSEKKRQYGFSVQTALEIGSMNINGSVRPVFADIKSYTGVDLQAGAGVDCIMNGHNLAFRDESFDLVISTEMLEHDDKFWASIREMGRVLRMGGMLMVTARGNGFMPHEFPHDYWRFLPSSFVKLLQMARCEVLEVREDWQPGHPGVFGLGRKLY
jgi:SAM-dependent methyltransferase